MSAGEQEHPQNKIITQENQATISQKFRIGENKQLFYTSNNIDQFSVEGNLFYVSFVISNEVGVNHGFSKKRQFLVSFFGGLHTRKRYISVTTQ